MKTQKKVYSVFTEVKASQLPCKEEEAGRHKEITPWALCPSGSQESHQDARGQRRLWPHFGPGASGHSLLACMQCCFGTLEIHLEHQISVSSVWALSSLSPSCSSSLVHSQKTSSHLRSTEKCSCYCSPSRISCRHIGAIPDLEESSKELLQSILSLLFPVRE